MIQKKHLLSLGLALSLVGSAAAQANDDCTGATVISGFGLTPFDNTAATPSGPSDCNGSPIRKDLWYLWTAPVSGGIRFETCDTSTTLDTRIAVYDADCGNLNLLACAANTCLGQSRVGFAAVAGQQYLLRVGSRQVGASGVGEFRLDTDACIGAADDALEDNETCAAALPLTDGTYTGLFVSKTDPDWFSFCLPPGATMTFNTQFTHGTGDIDIFGFVGCGTGSAVIGGSASDNETITMTNMDPVDQDIFVRVELWSGDTSNDCNTYTLNVAGSGGCTGSNNVGTNYCMANTNSTGSIGTISAQGTNVAADNILTLGAASLPVNAFAFFLTSLDQGFAANPGGSAGNLCLGGSIGRYVGTGQIQQADATGTIALALDLTMVPQPLGFVAIAAGETWNFQAWYRDSVGGSATSNFTDGLTVDFQ